MKESNELNGESSPYLRQHAHNPVNWKPWSKSAFEEAKMQNKLVLVSIGYSSCHWCHVMEKECFEDEEVAQWMNAHFINIKVDREERPDVDQVYMTAVQLMTQRGGWPLNCFTLPDGRPIYGGTYFPKQQWIHVLRSLIETYKMDKEKVLEYAEMLTKGVQASEFIELPTSEISIEKEKLHELVLRWSHDFDKQTGGNSRAPKFPLPNNLCFLLAYGHLFEVQKVLRHVELTLDNIALGGIYDQIGGGWYRYSVDALWKIPHFEKMLYDNAQLVGLYARAFKYMQKPDYRRVVEQTTAWLEREMQDESGSFYAALDADSEGIEGKFYCWSKEEFEQTVGIDTWALEAYSINAEGYWEHGQYNPLRKCTDIQMAKERFCSVEEWQGNLKQLNDTLLQQRSYRIRPSTDDKCLAAWNAMLLEGLCDAFLYLEDTHYLEIAEQIASWLEHDMITTEGKVHRCYHQGKVYIDGFLDDYAFTIQAFISLYQSTFHVKWLQKAHLLMDYALIHFEHPSSALLCYAEQNDDLIARKMEVHDNVIPSSNSVMARNLFVLGQYFSQMEWVNRSRAMVACVYDGMEKYGSGYSNWADVLRLHLFGSPMVCGSEALKKELHQIKRKGYEVLLCASDQVPIMHGKKEQVDRGNFFICLSDGRCLEPTHDQEEVIRNSRLPILGA
jgi:uncharacterized protein YyaL (SSP411 family)